MEYLANYVAVLTVVEYSFLRLMPSLIAASAVFLARWTLDQSNHPWLNTSGSTLVAIRKKYNQEKIFCVPDIVPEDPVADEGYDEATEQRTDAERSSNLYVTL
uniref:Cyclin C-terminal domain-containing protein n=1 Tax=Brassica oleracea var. oleracea TaxID=109376 RepID=A0A0D3E8T3_BRAOL